MQILDCLIKRRVYLDLRNLCNSRLYLLFSLFLFLPSLLRFALDLPSYASYKAPVISRLAPYVSVRHMTTVQVSSLASADRPITLLVISLSASSHLLYDSTSLQLYRAASIYEAGRSNALPLTINTTYCCCSSALFRPFQAERPLLLLLLLQLRCCCLSYAKPWSAQVNLLLKFQKQYL